MGRRHQRTSRPQSSKRAREMRALIHEGDLDLMVRYNAERDRDREVWR